MNRIKREIYENRLRAAFLCRAAGCTLGAPVEGWSTREMEELASSLGTSFPPTDYWKEIPSPERERYIVETFGSYTKKGLSRIPCDDDIGYTLLSLFIAEEAKDYPDITLSDVASAWQKYITVACTAEDVALKNLQNGVPPEKAAELGNPYSEWIGADIRCDGYGYMNPGNPASAADMAETDALISHRGNGVYGSRFFAAAIASAFLLSDVKSSLYAALAYIPSDCQLFSALSWALGLWGRIGDYKEASALVDEKFPGMNPVHTVNNACLTVFALSLGGRDCGSVISNAVAMAHDCDCTAATAGSIVGAAYGTDCIDAKWYMPFGDSVGSYFNGAPEYFVSDILARFEKKASRFLE